jgi:HSP20 family molecular chaperone IbpA
MFKKGKCKKCKEKIDEKYSFCPYCGNSLSEDKNEENWGMLGKSDFMPSANRIKLPLGFNTIFNSLMKNLSKEFEGEFNKNHFQTNEKPGGMKKDGISISISTFGNGPPKIKVTQLGEKPKLQQEEIKEKVKSNMFTKEKIKKFSDLPKEEPKTEIRRLSSKIIYEIKMPGIKSLEDISIVKLENSIEIKAITKNKAYLKTIPLNLPITDCNISEGKLILELGIRN